jgi:uncharacterized protein (TIGR02646 family)
MIFLDRNAVAPPADFVRRGHAETVKLAKAVKRRSKSFLQNRLPFRTELLQLPDLSAALLGVFGKFCAFCESPLLDSELNLPGHFRPRERASQLSGKVSPLHYWWLSYEWHNIYSMCLVCRKSRGTRFPVKGARAEYEHATRTLESERAQLLDPCADDPTKELQFLFDGSVRALGERGHATIETFGLNRASLVNARLKLQPRIREAMDTYLRRHDPSEVGEDEIAAAVMRKLEGAGFRGFIRQVTRILLEGEIHPESKEPSTLGTFKARRHERGAVWLRRVEIENFRALRHLVLEFPDSHDANANRIPAPGDVVQSNIDEAIEQATAEPWVMLLGENGVGKSSLLKAVALAMMPESQTRRFGADPREWVTRGVRAQSGRIRLEFTVGAQPLELHFSRRSRVVARKGDYPHMSVLGYGSTRLLPAPDDAKPRPERVRVQNLFDPRAPLRNAESWLADPARVSIKHFNLLASSLRSLLSLGESDRITRRDKQLFATLHNRQIPIRWLSDGYQSVLALALDMMRNLAQSTFDMGNVEGVVLIDELETHLHPRWKLRIVGELRKLFPRVRFIATTHDPLCVQGIRPGELHVLTRQPDDGEVRIEQFDLKPGMRADQVLTGAWFGVDSTRDPETVDLMQRHSQLLQKGKKRTADEQRAFAALDVALRERMNEYAGTEEEQLALKVAADFRSERRQRLGKAAELNSADLRDKVRAALVIAAEKER